jgi:hypothetical protein
MNETIPAKIKEIISYLSYSFSSKVLERDDISQDLYTLYCEMLTKDPRAAKAEPGYFFIKFKWHLQTKYRKEVKRICREWDFILSNDEGKTKKQSNVGYLNEDSDYFEPPVDEEENDEL